VDWLGYGIVVTNTWHTDMTVRVTSRGFIDSEDGGQVFVQMFNPAPLNETYALSPGEVAWIFRNDRAASNLTIFQGGVDFETNAPVRVDNVCYADWMSVNPLELKYNGYVQRIDAFGPDDERLVYKGVAPVTAVTTLPLSFTLDDSMLPNSALPISYPFFDVRTGNYAAPKTHDGWFSNISPASNPAAVTSDMVAVLMNGWGFVDPTLCCDGAGHYPNVGNWGYVYTVRGSFTNVGQKDQRVTLSMKSDGCPSPFAVQSGSGALWRAITIQPSKPQSYGSTLVPRGSTVQFTYRYVLTGPGCGGEYHWFTVL